MLNFGETSTTTDNNGDTVGVFSCDTAGTRTVIAYLASDTYNAFAIEAIIKISAQDILYQTDIISLYGTTDNTDGNGIGFNQNGSAFSNNLNIFYPSNTAQIGWYSSTQYLSSPSSLEEMTAGQFYHVIISQNAAGLVNTFINGLYLFSLVT